MCACFPHLLSIISPLCPFCSMCWCQREGLYVLSYPRTGNRTCIFQRHILSNGTTSRPSLAVYPLDDEMNLLWLWLLLQDLLFLLEIYFRYVQGRPPLPTPAQASSSPFSWTPSRSPLYLTHPVCPKFELCLVKFNRGQGMLSRSILDGSVAQNESEMTIAYARRGRLTRSIWSLQFEGLLPLVREVVRGSSGFGL